MGSGQAVLGKVLLEGTYRLFGHDAGIDVDVVSRRFDLSGHLGIGVRVHCVFDFGWFGIVCVFGGRWLYCRVSVSACLFEEIYPERQLSVRWIYIRFGTHRREEETAGF